MKFNKWTLALAAIGAVSLTSAAHADEAKITALQTTLSNTTISGYVDTAVQYNTGSQSPTSVVPAGTSQSKIDNFSLNDLDIAIDHPLDSTAWAAGYHVDVNWGSDAIDGLGSLITNPNLSGVENFGVRQAYVALSTPVGNGITWKMGVQDDIIGYEGNTDAANPNYTRSVGYFLEPTTLVGLIGSYTINSIITVQGGIANATSGNGALSSKTFAGAVALTAPDSWGFLKGGTANLGVLINPEKSGQNNFYAGVTIPTPISALKVGASFDLVSIANQSGAPTPNANNDSGWDIGLYGNYQATDKLSLNLRGEFFDLKGGTTQYNTTAGINPYGGTANGVGEEVTATVAYNLWANVTSRVEARWDHAEGGAFGTDPVDYQNSFILALNVVYSF
jgi:hypothetical protein